MELLLFLALNGLSPSGFAIEKATTCLPPQLNGKCNGRGLLRTEDYSNESGNDLCS